jgi:formylglycine-generating enzyme required for sulfatase activity
MFRTVAYPRKAVAAPTVALACFLAVVVAWAAPVNAGGKSTAPSTTWMQLADARKGAADRLFLKAIKLYRAGDLAGAAENFEMGLSIDPENPVAHFYFAETLSDMKRGKDAIAHYRKAAELAPGSEEGIIASLKLKKQAKKLAPGRVFKDCDVCPEMVIVPAGKFMMGSTDAEQAWAKGKDRFHMGMTLSSEAPRHEVILRASFAVGRYEVTIGQWRECLSAGACVKPPDPIFSTFDTADPQLPVVDVSWQAARAYMNWLSKRTGQSYRFLSEAEWEYAARAGTTTAYNVGRDIDMSQANFHGGPGVAGTTSLSKSVGQFKPNAFGIFDVHGSVAELVEDCWHWNYEGALSDGSAWTKGGDCNSRVVRGGSSVNGRGPIRSASRSFTSPAGPMNFIGFRVARDLD